MKCAKCDTEFEGNFCPGCGAKAVYCAECGERSTGAFCQECGAKLPDGGTGIVKQPPQELAKPGPKYRMRCPRCGGEHINISPVTTSTSDVEVTHRGCLAWLGWILLACVTAGLILIIPALTNSRTKGTMRTTTYNQAVCQNCGHSWRVK